MPESTGPRWQYLLLAVAAAVLTYSHTPVGAALSMDSLFYLSTAGNILDGHGIAFTTYALNGPAVQATTLWPPLYPLVLAGIVGVAEMLGISSTSAVAFCNFVALLVSLVLILRIASIEGWGWAALVVGIACVIAPSLQLVHIYVWSEAFFLPMVLGAYLCLQRYLLPTEEGSRKSLYCLIALFALATYTRYVGIAFFGAAATALLIYERGNLLSRVRTAALASLAYVILIVPILIRNVLVSDDLAGGDRGIPGTELLTDLGQLAWYIYLEFINLPNSAGAALLVISAAAVGWMFMRSEAKAAPPSSVARESMRWVVPLLFVASYSILILLSRMVQVTDLDSRMLSVAVPFLLLAVHGIYLTLASRTGNSSAALPFVLLLCVFFVNAVNTHRSILTGWKEQGEPGAVLGLVYPSMTGTRLDTLRSIGEHFSPGDGDLVLTDLRQPVIAGYLFPQADVRKVPGEPDEENLAAVIAVMQRNGLAIIGQPDWGQALSRQLEDKADFYRIESAAGKLEYIVIALPVRSQ
tara:strand:+ start:4342 stop:5916 length:1575 start_codon:yes stop_codon:yes gene_type:complete